jgi:histidinol-phosphate aminotransferase
MIFAIMVHRYERLKLTSNLTERRPPDNQFHIEAASGHRHGENKDITQHQNFLYRIANPSILPINPYKPGKPISEVKKELGLENIVKLASNENPAGPSPYALEVLQSTLSEIGFYPEDSGIGLKRALANKYDISCDNLVIGRGATEILEIITRAFVCPDDEIISAHPSFPWFQMLGQMSGAKNVIVPLRSHTHDLQTMADSVTPKTKLIFIANPNNPTGTIVGRHEIDSFLKLVPDDVIVVLDEAYIEYVTDKSISSLTHIWQKPVIIVRTFSKIAGLAGLRIGYGIAQPVIIELLEKVRQPFNTTALAQAAAVASLEDHNHLERSREMVMEGKDFLYTHFKRLGLDYVPSEANFILVDFRIDAEVVFKALLDRGFIVRPMLKTCARITVGLPQQNASLINALGEILSVNIFTGKTVGIR